MLIAVDTNVLLDRAVGHEDVVDALETIGIRLQSPKLIVTPTVLEELAWQMDHDDKEDLRNAAHVALASLSDWGFEALNLIPVDNGIVEQMSLRFRTTGLIPEEEENDASILSEAALLGCEILLTSDRHLLEAQKHQKFRELLKDCGVEGDRIVVAAPRSIVQKFFR